MTWRHMSKHLLAILALGSAVCMAAPPLQADHGDKGKGHKHEDSHDDRGWERRDGYEYRSYADGEEHPPGWNRGKKTGWKNCGLPPGQAKKYGCRTYLYEGRPHYYYEDEKRQIIVRRPI